MKRYMYIMYPILGVFILLGVLTFAQAQSVNLMTREQLKGMMGDSDLIILDARSGRDWKSSEFKIKSAVRANPYDFDTWKSTHAKDKTLVLYCA